ncbi:Vacuolar protein-sorting-associated protein 25 [Erysiphe neolycopersici]|uniref:Vacuolar protein-sorting-associated protein 25 n=1 Tax=Erysiphe neolycopersici TaxID=212602 RepID=A0A420HDX8_9PEZI|nr:Vacuolar protein-sorting-associated protein 25 [Erysiphe neolycopersici]
MSSTKENYGFPSYYDFPPFFTLQPNSTTKHAQLQKWSTFILSYARHHRLFKLSLSDSLDSELFYHKRLGKRLSREDATEVVEFMRKQGRAEWIISGGSQSKGIISSSNSTGAGGASGSGGTGDPNSGVFWIWWKNVEEWGETIADWVDETGQKNMVLTLYELTEGESTLSQEFHGLHSEILQRALAGLVKRGKAQVFGQEDQQGVKFF